MWRVVLLFLLSLAAYAEEPRCPQRYLLKPTDPVYQDASALAARLRNAGVVVECVLPSKRVNTFAHQTGAAFFRTKLGDFELLVLTTPYNFNGEVIEEQVHGCYRYSFRGSDLSNVNGSLGESCPKKWYFVKRHNELLMTQDETVANRLGEALPPS